MVRELEDRDVAATLRIERCDELDRCPDLLEGVYGRGRVVLYENDPEDDDGG